MPGFKDIVGHEDIKQHLQTAISQNKVSHAYLINGEAGSGKKMLAAAFAKALACEEKGIEGCGKCRSCMQAETGNHPDIIWVKHEKYSIGVDDIRSQVNQDIGIKPYYGGRKVYIIADAGRMTEQAQNSLLKTMEEPPEYGVVILLADNQEYLLPTVLSRCVALNLKPVKPEEICRYLMQVKQISEASAAMAAQFSQGNIGRAIRYGTSENFEELKKELLHFLKSIGEMEIAEMIHTVKVLSEHKMEIEDCIDFMQLWFRDVLLFKVTNDPNMIVFKDEYHAISGQARRRGYEEIGDIIKAMEKAKRRLDANVNFDITMELMFLTMQGNKARQRES